VLAVGRHRRGLPPSFSAWFFLALGVGTVLSSGGGCKGPQPAAPTGGMGEAPARVAGILLEKLRQAELRVLWTASAPVERSQRVQRLFYRGGRLYVLTDTNMLYAFDARSGIVQWSAHLAEPAVSCSIPSFYRGRMIFTLAETVVEVRESDGRVLRRMMLPVHATTNAVRTEDRLFLGGEDRRFYCLRLKDGVPLWQAIDREPPVGSVAVAADRVYFVRRDGTLYVSRTDRRVLLWKAQAAGTCPGVLVDRNQCLLPSEDTALYCFDPSTGRLLWKYLAGGALVELPALTESAVYQPVKHRALACINRSDGSLRWELAGGRGLLAENGSRTYAVTFTHQLTIMNNTTGKQILAFSLPPEMTVFARNTEDAMIFLGDLQGRLVALQPERLERTPPVTAAPAR